ncbi:MAG TPA: ABC transporter ATP-binding protein [Nitrospinota bacterium]|nr:ABC transporter ATP-binding protein [Nitrospinota bacterium]|tara:strand:+ start:108838 stop:110565 length:1728 start_codon:yes stop_codon:yes gene_type:complete
MNLYRRLLAYLKPYLGKFLLASIFMIFVSASAGAAALIIQPILDDIFLSKNEVMLILLPLGVIAIYAIRGIGRYFASSLMQIIGQLAVRDIRDHLFKHLQSLSLKFYSSRQTGQLMSRITNDVQVIQDSVSIVVYDLMRESLTMTVLLCVVFYRDWKLALFALTIIPFSAILIDRLGKRLRKISKISQEKMAELNSLLHETFTGIRVVQAFGMEEYETTKFKNGNAAYFDTVKKIIKINELSSPLLEFIGAFGIAAIIWYGGTQVIAGHTTVGSFFSFMTALFMLFQPISKLSRVYNKTQQALAAAQRVFDILDTKALIKDKKDAISLDSFNHQIEFNNVSFEYEPDRPVLEKINLCINKGTIVAFVGSSGAGKTTLVNLIPRFFDVTDGAILIDNHDLRDVSVHSLREKIGIVTQDIFLFHDTIRNNIAYGQTKKPLEDVQHAAVAAYAHDFIMQTPDGYDSIIGERGMKLSGGQRQRISIARAIMKDPSILIFDEATSALDTESEVMVQKALKNLMSSRTTFVIAHRLSTILHADLIVTLDGGKIIEFGPHAELLAKGGTYSRLFELQFSNKT